MASTTPSSAPNGTRPALLSSSDPRTGQRATDPLEPGSRSDSQEDLAPVHPEQDRPEDEQDRKAAEDGFERRSQERERGGAEMADQGCADEMLDRPADHVDGDRIRPDHQQRERPSLPFQALDGGVEQREHED